MHKSTISWKEKRDLSNRNNRESRGTTEEGKKEKVEQQLQHTLPDWLKREKINHIMIKEEKSIGESFMGSILWGMESKASRCLSIDGALVRIPL